MNYETAKRLCELNTEFYAEHADSFSASRHAPWPGWSDCLNLIKEDICSDAQVLNVFDLACGNLRFESFLRNNCSGLQINYYAVDNCDDLLPQGSQANYQNLDILDLLFKEQNLNTSFKAPECDLALCFGFMHHIPLLAHRKAVLESLIKQVRPGGYIIVTFWQFMKDEKLRNKALVVHENALAELGLPKLSPNDFLLDWNNIPGTYRYCHSFSDDEIDDLIADVAQQTQLISRFISDGRSNTLNTYLILSR
ncbi:MAG: class I SAM-dependent methyltransferase [Coriobacteriia bacterium]|nr:class I SAM-dependent methyltransferase [Coriobacteriia bacterium]MCL2749392.1 class I SAM-dependent methyltransferase [Coriobacteriia bacterium]